MGTFNQKRVIITGASSGIGAALAKQLAGSGATVFLVARRKNRLEAMARAHRGPIGAMHAVEGDVCAKPASMNSIERLALEVNRLYGPAHLVVANAGFGVTGSLDSLTLADFRRQFETNVFGVLRTAMAFLPQLKETRGTLVLVSSVAGHVAPPGVSPYTMSKFAVRALAESIRAELAPHGVKVVLVSPGFIDTEIHQVDNQGAIHEAAIDGAPRWLMADAATAARAIARGIRWGRAEVVVTWHGKAIVLLTRLAPWFIRLLSRFMASTPSPSTPTAPSQKARPVPRKSARKKTPRDRAPSRRRG
ncbi:MAG: SDR family NAD(P)-dependent oxidoreductase [Spirochaetes bacterium]|nr:SDR family NAD(P)-dependent oxidoreductase [Spirochaetota bacterium]